MARVTRNISQEYCMFLFTPPVGSIGPGKINPLSANPTKWSNTIKQFVSKLPTNCLNVFDHFVKLALKGLKKKINKGHEKKNECGFGIKLKMYPMAIN